MKQMMKLIVAFGGLSAAMLGITQANAAGTTAGTPVNNTATLDYRVGAVNQTTLTATNTFTVDRKINLTVAELGTTTTTVAPGQSGVAPASAAYTTFTVTNNSNDVIDVLLTAANLTTGTTAPHTGTDAFDVSTFRFYVDTDASGTFTAADTLVTFLDELAADAVRTVFVIADVPAGATNGQISAISLTGQAAASGNPGTAGTALAADTGVNSNLGAAQNVFADVAGSDDLLKDGRHSARDDYTVSAATLTVSKISKIISDPFSSSNPKMIPGAVVEYCIIVANAAGGAGADNVAISDPLPPQTTFVPGSIRINGTVTAGVCNADGVAGGSFAGITVSGNLGTVATGTTRTLYFQVTVN
jgi:uncharacterized repeat protein (TIGR01451 family)